MFLLIVGMVGFFPYSTGYYYERLTLWRQMKSLYNWNSGEWQFGYAILPVVTALLWMTKKRYVDLEIRPSWWGLGIIVLGFIFYLAGYRANEKYLGFAGCQFLIMGMVLWFFGKDYFRKAFLLWVLLGMIWPIIPLIPAVSFPMRMMVTKMTVTFLNFIGVDTIQNGTALLSAATSTQEQGEYFSLQVAAPCSGLRSLMALFMLGLSMAYMSFEKIWKSSVLLFTVFPLALLGNFVRLLILLVGSVTLGNEVAIGKGEHDPSAYHLGAGFLVYIIALVGLVALVGVLKKGKLSFRKNLKKTIVKS